MPAPVPRAATRADLPAINRILNQSIDEGCANLMPAARSMAAAQAWFAAHDARHPIFVIELHGRVAAWGSLSRFRENPGYNATVEHSVYVARAYRGQGLGRILLRALISAAQSLGHHAIVAVITAENGVSIRLHEAEGFAPCGVLREVGFKNGEYRDVAFFQKLL